MECTVVLLMTKRYVPKNITRNGSCWYGLRNFSVFSGFAFFPQEWLLTYTTLQSQLNRRTRTVQLQTKHLLWGKRKPTESTEIAQTEPTTAISGYVLWYIAVCHQ